MTRHSERTRVVGGRARSSLLGSFGRITRRSENGSCGNLPHRAQTAAVPKRNRLALKPRGAKNGASVESSEFAGDAGDISYPCPLRTVNEGLVESDKRRRRVVDY